MWLFGHAAKSSGDASGVVDLGLLREEAEELRLKLEALRMAEEREARRAAHDSEVPPAASSYSGHVPKRVAGACFVEPRKVIPTPFGIRSLPTLVEAGGYAHADDSTTTATAKADDKSEADLQQLHVREAKLKQQEEDLGSQAADQTNKFAAASKVLERTRKQMQQMSQQLEAKEHQGSTSGTQAEAFHKLLAEKEQRLNAILKEATSALELGHLSVSESILTEEAPQKALTATKEPSASPQKATLTAAMAAKEQAEEHMLQLVSITEELTDALERAQEAEQDARQQLEATAERLQQERKKHSAYESELKAAMEKQDALIAELQLRLREQEQSVTCERARVRELEAAMRPKQMEM